MTNLKKSSACYEAGSPYLLEATHYIEPIIERGEGSFVWDVDGNRYLDFNAGQFCMTFGHGYRPFIDEVSRQMGKIYHTNTSALAPEVFEGARDLARVIGGDLRKTLFLSTGSEANEAAIRYAKVFTGRDGIACISDGYHGLTLGSQGMTMGGRWARPRIPGSMAVLTPDCVHRPESVGEEELVDCCIADARRLFDEDGDSIAAFIVEPIIGVGGLVEMPARYLRELRGLCDEHGSLLIFDECQCGFGRSGEWFVFQSVGVAPDILVTAKAMGNGLAVSSATFSERVAEGIEGRIVHFSSHQNDPLSAAVVSFVIREIEKNDLLDRNREMGKVLVEALERACSTTAALKNARGFGLMCAFDVNDEAVPDYREYSSRLSHELQGRGVLIQAIRQGRTFRLMPNYFISREEIGLLEEALSESARALEI